MEMTVQLGMHKLRVGGDIDALNCLVTALYYAAEEARRRRLKMTTAECRAAADAIYDKLDELGVYDEFKRKEVRL